MKQSKRSQKEVGQLSSQIEGFEKVHETHLPVRIITYEIKN